MSAVAVPADHLRYTLSAKDAAVYLSLALKTLYEKAEAGEIDHLRTTANVHTRIVNGVPRPYRKHGRLKFSQAGLDAWIAARRSPVVPAARPRPAATRASAALPEPARKRFA